MLLRTEYEKQEMCILDKKAAKASESRGRKIYEEECNIRTCFQRDRDRILHSKAFRRLKHKTQVFISPSGDHYRTRLTHTLEVSQISRTIGRVLRLNEDLIEAISLGHDLGHTPFGHIGEYALNNIMKNGFEHNEQSRRVLQSLEKLNCTEEVLDGVENHTGKIRPLTLEGQIVKIADRVAYINHDIDDSLRAGLLDISDLPVEAINLLGETHSKRINNMVLDIISESKDLDYIRMSSKVENATNQLREFLFENIYLNSEAKEEDVKAKRIIEYLFAFYVDNIKELPIAHRERLREYDKETVIADYISGMTDRYIVDLFGEIFIPKSWSRNSDSRGDY